MNLEVTSMTVFPNTYSLEGDRHFLTLNVTMSRAQIERAICALLGQLTGEQATDLLRTDFPEFFTTESNA